MQDSEGLAKKKKWAQDLQNYTARSLSEQGKAGLQKGAGNKVEHTKNQRTGPGDTQWSLSSLPGTRFRATQLLFLSWVANEACYVLFMLPKALPLRYILCVLYINPLLAFPFYSISPWLVLKCSLGKELWAACEGKEDMPHSKCQSPQRLWGCCTSAGMQTAAWLHQHLFA